MAMKPARPCRKPGCCQLTRDGWCDAHRPVPQHQRRISAEWHAWYGLPLWKYELRPRQLAREPFCRECARRGLRVRATVVDHIVPHRGDWLRFTDPGNLQSLCKTCHDRKTAAEQAEEKRTKISAF